MLKRARRDDARGWPNLPSYWPRASAKGTSFSISPIRVLVYRSSASPCSLLLGPEAPIVCTFEQQVLVIAPCRVCHCFIDQLRDRIGLILRVAQCGDAMDGQSSLCRMFESKETWSKMRQEKHGVCLGRGV